MIKIAQVVIQLIIKIMICLAAATLAAMMFLMAADVVGRYFFNSPIPGGLEMVEYMMAIIVPLSVAYCALNDGHVAVELLVDRFPLPVQRFVHFFTTGLGVFFVGLISWQNFLYIGEFYRSNLTSAVIKIPAYPFVAATAIGMTVFTCILICQLFSGKKKE